MHELPVIEKIISIGEEQARKNSAVKVLSLTLETGAFSDLEPQWMERYFRKAARGTMLEEAELIINREKAFYFCQDCRCKEPFQGQQILSCSRCHSKDLTLEGKKGYIIKEMKVV